MINSFRLYSRTAVRLSNDFQSMGDMPKLLLACLILASATAAADQSRIRLGHGIGSASEWGQTLDSAFEIFDQQSFEITTAGVNEIAYERPVGNEMLLTVTVTDEQQELVIMPYWTSGMSWGSYNTGYRVEQKVNTLMVGVRSVRGSESSIVRYFFGVALGAAFTKDDSGGSSSGSAFQLDLVGLQFGGAFPLSAYIALGAGDSGMARGGIGFAF